MTSLWFEHLNQGDRVSVKPHASPVLKAINYLLGELDAAGVQIAFPKAAGVLTADAARLLRTAELPSRSKDNDPVDYSNWSVGIAATAPIWGALARRYVNTHFGGAGTGRQYSLVGDAELDEGAVWEAVIPDRPPMSRMSAPSSTSSAAQARRSRKVR